MTFPGKKKWLAAVLLLGAVVGLAMAWRSAPGPRSRHSVRFALPLLQSSALVLLADSLGYFRDEGIDAKFETRATGKLCLDLVLQGDADYAVAYETPIMHAASAGHRLSVLTELHRSETNTAVLARRDRGIRGAEDLRGRVVAVVPKTNAEFLLRLYLRTNLVKPGEVRIEPLTVPDTVAAVRSGKVDAAVLWEPYLSEAIGGDSEAFVLLRSPYYSEFSLLVGRRDALREDQEAPYAVLRALRRASAYYDSHTEAAQARVDELMKKQGVFVSPKAWGQIDVRLGMSATLLAMLTEEANSFRSRETLHSNPEMNALLRGEFLRRLAPELVTYE